MIENRTPWGPGEGQFTNQNSLSVRRTNQNSLSVRRTSQNSRKSVHAQMVRLFSFHGQVKILKIALCGVASLLNTTPPSCRLKMKLTWPVRKRLRSLRKNLGSLRRRRMILRSRMQTSPGWSQRGVCACDTIHLTLTQGFTPTRLNVYLLRNFPFRNRRSISFRVVFMKEAKS